jgi:hypothetical protein
MNNIFYKVLLVGGSGRGKTYSFRNMDRARTLFIDVENKPLPFMPPFTNIVVPTTTTEVLTALQSGSRNPDIDVIVVDSFSAYVDMALNESRATKRGFDIWNSYNELIGKFNSYVKNVKKTTFVTAHYEIITDEIGGNKERRVKCKGKEWEGLIEKDYTVVLYTDSRPIENARPEHFFHLVNDGTTSTKIPPEVFGEDAIFVTNDSNIVYQKLSEFTRLNNPQ